SPPLVVAYALAGSMHTNLLEDPLAQDAEGRDVYLRDIWPTEEEVRAVVDKNVRAEMFSASYGTVFDGDGNWRGMGIPEGDKYAWSGESTYLRKPPYFDGMEVEPAPVEDIAGARLLALLGDSVTTDHISPA